jgi:hypothetical protein
MAIFKIKTEKPKEEYPIGHPKGFSEQEFLEYMEKS